MKNLIRSETVVIKLDKKLHFALVLAARSRHLTISSYVEWAIKEYLKKLEKFKMVNEEKLKNILETFVTILSSFTDDFNQNYLPEINKIKNLIMELSDCDHLYQGVAVDGSELGLNSNVVMKGVCCKCGETANGGN